MKAQKWLSALALFALLFAAGWSLGNDLPEYRLKAAFLYNFALFTEWPPEVGGTLQLCIVGTDPFGHEIDILQGKVVGNRNIAVTRQAAGASLAGCHIVFVAATVVDTLPNLLEGLRGRPVLTVADSAGAARNGVALNLAVDRNRIAFEANLIAARGAGLKLSSKLLRLATEVIQ